RRGLLGDRLQLRTASMGALGGIPGATMDTVTLHFDKAHRAAAENLSIRVSAAVSEHHAPTQAVLWEHSAHPRRRRLAPAGTPRAACRRLAARVRIGPGSRAHATARGLKRAWRFRDRARERPDRALRRGLFRARAPRGSFWP